MKTAEQLCYRENTRSQPERTKRILDKVLDMAKKSDEWKEMTEDEQVQIEREFRFINEFKRAIRSRVRA